MNVSMKNIVVFVTDLAKAKSFYVDLLQFPVAGQSEMLMEFFPGAPVTMGVALALSDDARKLVGRHTAITLKVEQIDTLCESLQAAGVRFIEPLEHTPWGKMAVIADFDGNQFAIVDR